ncbi:hypothetical protein AB0F72_14685 [Actinoplanes sp. NPDC023936]|uniref:hypothetical protein n=1 Tax=Actinoplanes sp. NPDC023936 TaxID=3154910 RepID=UPI0033E09852
MQKVIRSAVEPVGDQVFVDSTGRRKRLLAVIGFLVALFAALYIGMVGASVVQASDSGLSTRASVATSASASTSASSSASASASS